LKILLCIQALFALAGGLFGPLYAVFVEEIGGDLLTAGSAYFLFALTVGILIFFISRWEDHVKHKEKLIIIGFGLSALGFLGYNFVFEQIGLFIVQIIFGLGEAVCAPAWDGLYSKYLDKGKFISEWGLYESLNYIIIALGALAGGVIAEFFGFRILFVIMFIISIIGLLISFTLSFKKRL